MIEKYLLGESTLNELIHNANIEIQNSIEKEIKKIYYKKRSNEFYTELTKEEILNKIDINNLETFLPYLKTLDYPYIEKIWKRYMIEFGDNKRQIFGKYIACMRLKGYICYGYKDSDFFNEYLEE